MVTNYNIIREKSLVFKCSSQAASLFKDPSVWGGGGAGKQSMPAPGGGGGGGGISVILLPSFLQQYRGQHCSLRTLNQRDSLTRKWLN